MELKDFLVMRHELMLVFAACIILIADLSWNERNKKGLRIFSLLIFFAVTVIGFLPAPTGILFGGAYKTSELQILMKNILNIGLLIVIIQSNKWLGFDIHSDRIPEYFILLLSTIIGMNFMISSGDFLMLYLGLELATIPVAALAAFDRLNNKSAEAGIKLILSSALSSGILLYGISMIYATTGSVRYDEVFRSFGDNSLQVLGFIFFFAGMCFKISIVPFHLWTADVYEGAPINITSYLSVVSKGAAIFILMTLLFSIFNPIVVLWQNVVYIVAVLTMTIGNLFAIRQKNLKRFLAFSSISQAGFILLGVISGTKLGMASVVYYLLIYIFSNLAAFGVVSSVSNHTGKENISDYDGLYHTNPKLSLTMMLALFSLAGIPPVAGFFGKFFLFASAAGSGFYILVLIGVLNAIISLYYYLLVVKAMFINMSDSPIAYFRSDNASRLALLICIAGIFVTGFASVIFQYIKSIAFAI